MRPTTWFLAGLGLTTAATLLLELLDTRLLSVLTWYHLSFFAVSIAMFGMAAGAVRVYLAKSKYEGAAAPGELARNALYLAISIPLSHALNLSIPIQHSDFNVTNLLAAGFTTVALAVPFYLSGIVVTIALTRIPGRSGLIYAVDLIGAAVGSILIIPLLESLNASSVALLGGALAAAAAVCFQRFSGAGALRPALGLAVLLIAGALANDASPRGLRVIYSKGQHIPAFKIADEFWTIHGRVDVRHSKEGAPPFWGPGRGWTDYRVHSKDMAIDGAAGTVMTRWTGDRDDLGWVKHDVTSLPYHLRKGGDAAVIGVGGGRDILTALWGECRSVIGIEINEAFIHLLNGPYRDYAGIADQPEVTLVHDEARSYLTRSRNRFDILQMSLIDTWAATGAGAFTLSENGLYTMEAWRVFLGTLKPGGIFSVSRWYSTGRASETSRLLSLATAALLDRGAEDPSAHIALVACQVPGKAHSVATLLVSTEPLRESDLSGIIEAADEYGFNVLVAPGREAEDRFLGDVVRSRSLAELGRVTTSRDFDYTPPTDQRPYFFNILKPTSLSGFTTARAYQRGRSSERGGVVAAGNIVATISLVALWGMAAFLVVTVIIGPLLRSGLPPMERAGFLNGLLYFGLIGCGFMLVQIPFIQRFSVYLGHPTYTVAVILFSMILATGIGSLLSDRIPVERQRRWMTIVPLGIASLLLANTLAIQTVIDSSIHLGLWTRCAIVVSLVITLALPMGICFPMGLRIVGRLSREATPWMWGVNGACGVLASISAVGISMWAGIHANLFVAVIFYAALALPANALWTQGMRR